MTCGEAPTTCRCLTHRCDIREPATRRVVCSAALCGKNNARPGNPAERCLWPYDLALLDDAEREMGYARRLDHPRAFQLNWRSLQAIEQPDTIAEQNGHQIDVDFVEKS